MTIKSTFEIADEISTAIRNDSSVSAFCTANFSAQPVYYVGFNEDEPPNAELIVVVVPKSKQFEEARYNQHSIAVGVVCVDETVTRSTAAGTVKFDGYKTVGDFEDVVFNAIQAYLNESSQRYSMVTWDQASYECFWPYFHGTRTISVSAIGISRAVTFNSQGGSSVASQIIDDGNLLTEPTAPTKLGFTFSGWYRENTYVNQWTFATDCVYDDTTLFAKWT